MTGNQTNGRLNMMTNKPLITQADLQAIHKANQLNRQTLQDGIRELVKSTHKGNTQTAELIKGVTTKWIN